MKYLQKKCVIVITFILVNLCFVMAQTSYSDCSLYGNCQPIKQTAPINNNTINVNNSYYLRGYTPFNLPYLSSFTEVDPVFGAWLAGFQYNYNQTEPAQGYCRLNFYNKTSNINATSYNITADYINANSFLMGQPLTGMLGSGLIQSIEGVDYSSGVNVTCTGLTCTYNQFEVRLASTTSATPAKYCNIPAGSFVAPDNTFSAYYIDANCAIQQTTYDTWYTSLMGKTQAWDFAHVLAHSGSVETSDTISLEQKRLAKTRLLTYYLDQAHVVSGFNIQVNGFPYFNITTGKEVFGMDVVNVNQKNITATGDLIELVGHSSASTWQFDDQRGLNLTGCDTGTSIATCTGNNWRRHFIFVVGYDDGVKNVADIHQLYPLQSLTYASSASCLDTITNPLTFTMPPEYIGANVMLYAYCAKRTDSAWVTSNFIDLRTTKTGMATGGTDISGLVPYTSATQNVNLGIYNLTAYTLNTTKIYTNITYIGSACMYWNGTAMIGENPCIQ